MNPGDLNQRITIQKNTGDTYNSLNERVPNWTEVAQIWAAVKVTGSRELYYAQKVYTETSVVFVIRYRTDLDGGMRIMCGTRIYEILGMPVDADGARVVLMISAKEVI